MQAEQLDEQWKFAILLLVQAIETSLKERLRRTHEVLIYANIDKPKHTVDLRLAISRLENISNIEFDSFDISSIKTASELRNQIVHFEFNLSIELIKLNFVKLVGFYSSFCQRHLDKDIISSLPYPLSQELLGLDNYVNELDQRSKLRMRDEQIKPEYIRICNVCGKESYVCQGYIDSCYVCGHYEPTIVCDICSELELESEIQNLDLSTITDFEVWKCICRGCFKKIGTEDESDVLY